MTFNCICCSDYTSPVMQAQRISINSPANYGSVSAPRQIPSNSGPQVQKMERVAAQYFKEADERNALLYTPPSSKPTTPTKITVEVKVTIEPAKAAPKPPPQKRLLTVEDIKTGKFHTDPELMAQYQRLVNNSRTVPPRKKATYWTFRKPS